MVTARVKGFGDFFEDVRKHHKAGQPHLRYGQVCFNVLYEQRPELAEQIQGGMIDPFYQDARVSPFFGVARRSLGRLSCLAGPTILDREFL